MTAETDPKIATGSYPFDPTKGDVFLSRMHL